MHYAGPSYTLFLRENYIEELKKRGPEGDWGLFFFKFLLFNSFIAKGECWNTLKDPFIS